MYRLMTVEFTKANQSISTIAVVEFLQLSEFSTPTTDFPAVLLCYLCTVLIPVEFKGEINLACNFILLEQIFFS